MMLKKEILFVEVFTMGGNIPDMIQRLDIYTYCALANKVKVLTADFKWWKKTIFWRNDTFILHAHPHFHSRFSACLLSPMYGS